MTRKIQLSSIRGAFKQDQSTRIGEILRQLEGLIPDISIYTDVYQYIETMDDALIDYVLEAVDIDIDIRDDVILIDSMGRPSYVIVTTR